MGEKVSAGAPARRPRALRLNLSPVGAGSALPGAAAKPSSAQAARPTPYPARPKRGHSASFPAWLWAEGSMRFPPSQAAGAAAAQGAAATAVKSMVGWCPAPGYPGPGATPGSMQSV